MSRNIDEKEIKSILFSMDNNKLPRPNGYNALFFKAIWDIIRSDVVKAINHFFTTGYLFKEVNCTIFAFVPKTFPFILQGLHVVIQFTSVSQKSLSIDSSAYCLPLLIKLKVPLLGEEAFWITFCIAKKSCKTTISI